jgi:histidyl-tRNA synthetase
MERLVLAMKEQGIQAPGLPVPQVALIYQNEAAKLRALQLLTDLRMAGVRAVLGFGDRSLKAQLRTASKAAVPYALVLGEQEMAAGEVLLQDMASGSQTGSEAGHLLQERISQGQVVAEVRKRL